MASRGLTLALDELLDALAEGIAVRVSEHLRTGDDTREGYLTPRGAARYLGVSRKRIYDLTSMRAIEPDGKDGRTPLFTRQTLDRHVQGG